MNYKPRFKIDMLPILGVLGLILIVLYFILINFSDAAAKPDRERSAYALFYKLYPKLGYRITSQYSLHLPPPRRDLLIYFDFDGDRRKLATIYRQWVKPGGTLFIAGIKAEIDPVSSRRLKVDCLSAGTIVKGGPAAKITGSKLNLKNRALKHLPGTTVPGRARIILTTRQGPLAYQTANGAGTVLVLTDSDLLKNNLLRGADVAVFLNELLKPYFKRRIYLLEPEMARGQRATPILAFLFQNKLRYLSLQMLWVGLLFLAWQGKRFGAPQLVAPYARRSLSEHLRAVGNWYQKTKALAIVDEINCEYFKYMLQKSTGFTLKTQSRAEQLAKIASLIAAGNSELGPEQLSAGLTKEASLTLSRLQRKVKLQEQILKVLQSYKIHQ